MEARIKERLYHKPPKADISKRERITYRVLRIMYYGWELRRVLCIKYQVLWFNSKVKNQKAKLKVKS